jgi:hypothetical protein
VKHHDQGEDEGGDDEQPGCRAASHVEAA